jgi:uncharacterized membrane protein
MANRGRPRSPETIDRDQTILDLIRQKGGKMSSAELAVATHLPINIVRLALRRLTKLGYVYPCRAKGELPMWCLDGDSNAQ